MKAVDIWQNALFGCAIAGAILALIVLCLLLFGPDERVRARPATLSVTSVQCGLAQGEDR